MIRNLSGGFIGIGLSPMLPDSEGLVMYGENGYYHPAYESPLE